MVGPPSTCVIDGGTCYEVVDQHVRELEGVTTLGHAVAREGEDASGPAAPGIVVPESGRDPTRKSGLTDGSPAAVAVSGPGLICSYLSEQAKDLGVAGRATAPAVAVALDEVGRWGGSECGTRKPSPPASFGPPRPLPQPAPSRSCPLGRLRRLSKPVRTRCPECRVRCGETGLATAVPPS
jgi:hypothetical protein